MHSQPPPPFTHGSDWDTRRSEVSSCAILFLLAACTYYPYHFFPLVMNHQHENPSDIERDVDDDDDCDAASDRTGSEGESEYSYESGKIRNLTRVFLMIRRHKVLSRWRWNPSRSQIPEETTQSADCFYWPPASGKRHLIFPVLFMSPSDTSCWPSTDAGEELWTSKVPLGSGSNGTRCKIKPDRYSSQNMVPESKVRRTCLWIILHLLSSEPNGRDKQPSDWNFWQKQETTWQSNGCCKQIPTGCLNWPNRECIQECLGYRFHHLHPSVSQHREELIQQLDHLPSILRHSDRRHLSLRRNLSSDTPKGWIIIIIHSFIHWSMIETMIIQQQHHRTVFVDDVSCSLSKFPPPPPPPNLNK